MKFLEDLLSFLTLPIFLFTYTLLVLIFITKIIAKCFIKIISIKIENKEVLTDIKKIFKTTQYSCKDDLDDEFSLNFKIIESDKYNLAILDKAYEQTILIVPPFLHTHQSPLIENVSLFFLQNKYNVHVLISTGIMSPSKSEFIQHSFIDSQDLDYYLIDYPTSDILSYEFGGRKIIDYITKNKKIDGKIILINCNFDWFNCIHTVLDNKWNCDAGKLLKEYYLRNQSIFDQITTSQGLVDKFLRKQTFSRFDQAFYVDFYGFYSQEDMYQTFFKIPENLSKEILVVNGTESRTANNQFYELKNMKKFNYVVLSSSENTAYNGYGDDLFLSIAKIWLDKSLND